MATGTHELTAEEADGLLASTILTDEGRQDPYSAYARLRAGAPRWRSGFGSIVLTRYADGLEALRHPKLGRPEADMDSPATLSGREPRRAEDEVTMLFLNPPDHTRIRGLVSRAFTPRRVEALRPRIAEILDPVLDRLADGGDVMTELAVPFPVTVISELLGVPSEGNEHIRPLVHAITAFIDPAADEAALDRAAVAGLELVAYFTDLIAEKRAHPDDGLLSALIEVEEAGDRLSFEELMGNTLLLYAAGFETTSNLIGNGLWLFLRNPAEWDRLRTDRSLLPSAVWEVLRADSPVQLNTRSVLEPVELFGERHPRGTNFIILQGCGNHDEDVYPDPGRFDVGRFLGETPPPLSFGWGAHHCLGAHLARAEGEIAFGALLDRFPRLTLDTDALGGATAPRYRPSFTLRGLESLPVRVA